MERLKETPDKLKDEKKSSDELEKALARADDDGFALSSKGEKFSVADKSG